MPGNEKSLFCVRFSVVTGQFIKVIQIVILLYDHLRVLLLDCFSLQDVDTGHFFLERKRERLTAPG